jgi:tetrathionate reductase subunit B
MKAFLVDVSICNGCYCCQIACKDEHVGNDWPAYAKPQPDTGQFWLKVNEFVRGTVPKVKMHYLPVLCMHCDKAPCMDTCPVKAIDKRKDGLVVIDPVKCTGCKLCVVACPYRVIFFNDDLNLAQKCTGCAHLLDRGWKEPRCVDACPTQALKYIEESEIKKQHPEAEVINPHLGTQSRVYYLNVPKKFVAGTVYDPVAEEIVKDALCTLTDSGSRQKFTTKTDGFGDFWFEGLKEGQFSLIIEKDGKSKKFVDISTEKDVNLGDIPLKV